MENSILPLALMNRVSSSWIKRMKLLTAPEVKLMFRVMMTRNSSVVGRSSDRI